MQTVNWELSFSTANSTAMIRGHWCLRKVLFHILSDLQVKDEYLKFWFFFNLFFMLQDRILRSTNTNCPINNNRILLLFSSLFHLISVNNSLVFECTVISKWQLTVSWDENQVMHFSYYYFKPNMSHLFKIDLFSLYKSKFSCCLLEVDVNNRFLFLFIKKVFFLFFFLRKVGFVDSQSKKYN